MQQVVYTASPESQQIHVWQLEASGALKLLQVVEVPDQVQPMVAGLEGKYLHVGVRPDFRVISYAIDAEGKLSQAGEAPLPGSPTHLSVDRTGRFLFCASYGDACVSISPLDAQGLLQAPTQVIGDLAGCHSASIDLSNQILYVPVLKQDRICLFNLGTNGELTPAAQQQVTTATGAGPRHMAFHPSQQYAYCVNELNSTVDVWQLHNTQGQVERIQSLDMMRPGFSATRWAADIHLTPDGHFLYSCDRTSSEITVFSVSEEGARLTIEGFQPGEQQPRGFSIDNGGEFLVVAGQKSDHIAVHKIDQTRGTLLPLARYQVGKGPMWVVIHTLK